MSMKVSLSRSEIEKEIQSLISKLDTASGLYLKSVQANLSANKLKKLSTELDEALKVFEELPTKVRAALKSAYVGGIEVEGAGSEEASKIAREIFS